RRGVSGERLALLCLAGDHHARRSKGEDIGAGVGRVVEGVPGRSEGLRGGHAAIVQELERTGDVGAIRREVGEIELDLGVMSELVGSQRFARNRRKRRGRKVGLNQLDNGTAVAVALDIELHHLIVQMRYSLVLKVDAVKVAIVWRGRQ